MQIGKTGKEPSEHRAWDSNTHYCFAVLSGFSLLWFSNSSLSCGSLQLLQIQTVLSCMRSLPVSIVGQVYLPCLGMFAVVLFSSFFSTCLSIFLSQFQIPQYFVLVNHTDFNNIKPGEVQMLCEREYLPTGIFLKNTQFWGLSIKELPSFFFFFFWKRLFPQVEMFSRLLISGLLSVSVERVLYSRGCYRLSLPLKGCAYCQVDEQSILKNCVTFTMVLLMQHKWEFKALHGLFPIILLNIFFLKLYLF